MFKGHIVYTNHGLPVGLISGVADPQEDPLNFGNCPNNIALGHWDPYYWVRPFSNRILGNIGTLHDIVGQVVLRNTEMMHMGILYP